MFALIATLSPVKAFAQSIPPGSYRDSCRNIRVSNGVLSAECAVPDGRMHRKTSIELSKCAGRDIENNSGRLECWLSPAEPGRFTLNIRGGGGDFAVEVLGVDVNKKPFHLSETRKGAGPLVFHHTAFPLRGIAITGEQRFEVERPRKLSVTCDYKWIFLKITNGETLTLNAWKYDSNPNSCDEKPH